MEILIANKSFGSLITKGNEYRIIRKKNENYVILDNDGCEVGFNSSWFDKPFEFNPNEFAVSIMRLMLFPKSKDFTHEDIIKGKAYSSLVIENLKGNCANDQELKQIEMIKDVIDKINNTHDFKELL